MPSNKMENLLRIVVRSFGLPQAEIYICQDSLVHGVGGEGGRLAVTCHYKRAEKI